MEGVCREGSWIEVCTSGLWWCAWTSLWYTSTGYEMLMIGIKNRVSGGLAIFPEFQKNFFETSILPVFSGNSRNYRPLARFLQSVHHHAWNQLPMSGSPRRKDSHACGGSACNGSVVFWNFWKSVFFFVCACLWHHSQAVFCLCHEIVLTL